MPIQIAIFDDNRNRRNSLQLLVNETDDMKCVGTFEDCSKVIEDVTSCRPHVILMDIKMPNVDGIEGVYLLRKKYPEIFIIMQTVFEDDNKIVSAIAAGANGYILKQTHPSKIIDGIRDVMEGGAPMTPLVAKRVLELFQASNVKKKTIQEYYLTDKEKEILSELVKGCSYKMIATNKALSVFTVNSHVRNIYKKNASSFRCRSGDKGFTAKICVASKPFQECRPYPSSLELTICKCKKLDFHRK